MADVVNRIVPPSVSLDRATPLGREREKRKQNSAHKTASDEDSPASTSHEREDTENKLANREEDKTKGKNLDINV